MNAFSAESEDNSYGAWGAARVTGLAGLDGSTANDDDFGGARPVLYLKSDIELTSGTGTKLDPFVIG